ncbi:E3 ubiquitin-protein ligase sina [Orchesella cincta]|uniref:E3 ubiquitin-protein ligase sina n=1 Tax=Orchesella cincta TaxID=48709 RepID=A0A1D2MWE7_ORCCI|nr:E3 ubiquitin-protein ligase sina [Orchesella cincta]
MEVEKLISIDDLIKTLECPVCYEFPAPPIYSCERGHFTCSSCMRFLKSCSICRARFTIARNYALEAIIEGSYFKCRNAYAGCNKVIKGDKLNSHTMKCLFRSFDCTEPLCSKKNLLPSEYLQHMMRNHYAIGCQEKLKNGKVTVTFIGMADQRYKPCYVNVIHPNSKVVTFFVFSRSFRSFTYNWATCPHPEYVSLYEVRFSLQGERDVKNLSIQWTLPVLPVSTNFYEIRDSGLCAAIPDAHLVPFYRKNSNIWNLKVELIQKEIEPQSPCRLCNKTKILIQFFILAILFAVFLLFFLPPCKIKNPTKIYSYSYGLTENELHSYKTNKVIVEIPEFDRNPNVVNNTLPNKCYLRYF